ncbi:hypothetical protein TIFTF001_040803 [Ficus carica]|uniref:Uncharacterized protein n=1 Tax=Ficus carica TaxID=3494 RepID=A0AA88CR10_FICCA|nr:hypothetical protein TIFTF001_040803 [Ficus carica]
MDSSLPIFTTHKILDPGHNPLQINLVDINYNRGDPIIAISRDPPPKVEIVVLKGDFPPRGHDSWTSQEFDDNIVKERNGKAPLIIGDLLVTLKHGVATFGDIKFTDNSSWIPTKKFKIGARLVAPGTHAAFQGRVLEAITEVPFVVREYRMGSFNFFLNEAFKKHHPPKLDDYVWRLEKIAKNGAFHKKLASEGIHTVKDFLNQSATTTGQKRLREVQQEIVTEFAASLAQGTAMLEDQPNLSHIIFYDEGATRLDEILASTS